MWAQLFSACFSSCVWSVCASICMRGKRDVGFGGGCDEKIEEIERSHTPILLPSWLFWMSGHGRPEVQKPRMLCKRSMKIGGAIFGQSDFDNVEGVQFLHCSVPTWGYPLLMHIFVVPPSTCALATVFVFLSWLMSVIFLNVQETLFVFNQK